MHTDFPKTTHAAHPPLSPCFQRSSGRLNNAELPFPSCWNGGDGAFFMADVNCLSIADGWHVWIMPENPFPFPPSFYLLRHGCAAPGGNCTLHRATGDKLEWHFQDDFWLVRCHASKQTTSGSYDNDDVWEGTGGSTYSSNGDRTQSPWSAQVVYSLFTSGNLSSLLTQLPCCLGHPGYPASISHRCRPGSQSASAL